MKSHDNMELESNRKCSNIIEKRYNGTEGFVRELHVNDGSLSIVFPRNFSRYSVAVHEVIARTHRK